MSSPQPRDQHQGSTDPTLSPDAILFGELAPGPNRKPKRARRNERRQYPVLPPLDRHRTLQRGKGKKFCFSTDLHETPEYPEGRCYSWIEKPVGPGSRSGKASSWEIVDSSVRSHSTGSKAKGRSVELYEDELS